MNYITFNEMIEVNGLLEEKGLNTYYIIKLNQVKIMI